MPAMKDAYRGLVRKTDGHGYLEKPRHRWEHIIKMHLRETERGSVGRIHSVQGRSQQLDVECSTNLQVL
jgi:hypothetical protein